jgi:hypothetical protein
MFIIPKCSREEGINFPELEYSGEVATATNTQRRKDIYFFRTV